MIIARARRAGKTTELVKVSAATGRYILAANRPQCETICKIANDLGVSIPYPITVSELRRSGNYTFGSSIKRDGLLVDELMMVLEALVDVKIKGATISLDDKKSDKKIKTHYLKIAPVFYEAVISGKKKFEIRVNDRNFLEGDHLVLREFEDEEYTGNEIEVLVTYIPDFPLPDNYVVMGIELYKEDSQ